MKYGSEILGLLTHSLTTYSLHTYGLFTYELFADVCLCIVCLYMFLHKIMVCLHFAYVLSCSTKYDRYSFIQKKI